MVKYKTLFRVLQHLVGLLVFAQGVVSLAGYLRSLFYFFVTSGTGFTPPFPTPWWTLIPIQGLVGVALGLYLFFGGKWIADLAIPGNRPYCDECGYDLTDATGDSCPECGTHRRMQGS